MSLEEWNERYRGQEPLDDDPAPLLVRAAEALPPGRALDLACGAGRNAAWLARRGWEVVAVDGSAEAIRLVRERPVRIDARRLDLESGAALPFDDESFDLVAILFYLHRPLYPEAMRVLRRGGLLVCAALMHGRYAIRPEELETTFAGLELLHTSAGEVAEWIARK